MSDSPKTLLMISYPFPPNPSAGAVRSERFARYLSIYGWKTEVLTIEHRLDMFEDINLLKGLGEHVNVHFTKTLDPWLWLSRKTTGNFFLRVARSILMRIFSFPDHMLLWVPFALRKALKICKKKKIDVIYTTSPPHSTHIAGLLLSKWLRIPWVADFRDPWTLNAYREESAIDALLLRAEKIMEKGLLRNASLILANTKANQKNLLMAFPFLDEKRVIHLPNGWEDFPERDHGKKENEVFTIVHSGTYYPRFKPYGLFHALAHWRNGNLPPGSPPWDNNIRVILLGSGDMATRKVVDDLGLQDIVEIRPWVALDEARKIMCQADALWASLGTGNESSTYIPSKLFEYFAARRPILGFFPEGEAADLIKQTNTGIVFTSDQPEPVIRALGEALEAKKKDGILYSPSKDVINQYHIRRIVEKINGHLMSLSNREN